MSPPPLLPDDLPDDPDAALAAEYVLRLLDPAEEAACDARIAADPAFAVEVEHWLGRLSALDDEFAEVAPPPQLKTRLETQLFGAKPSVWSHLWNNVTLWRGVAAAALVFLAVIFSLGRWTPQPGMPQLVAAVSQTGSDVQLVALYDRDAGLLRFTHLGGTAPAGQSLELWVLPEGDTAPASLGIVPADGSRFAVRIPADVAARVGEGTAILVSQEQAGGSPTGQPQGAVVAQGAIRAL